MITAIHVYKIHIVKAACVQKKALVRVVQMIRMLPDAVRLKADKNVILIRLIHNRVEKFSDDPYQGMVDYAIPKDSIIGIAFDNVTCTKNESGEEVCEDVTASNEMKEDEYFPGLHTSTFQYKSSRWYVLKRLCLRG